MPVLKESLEALTEKLNVNQWSQVELVRLVPTNRLSAVIRFKGQR